MIYLIRRFIRNRYAQKLYNRKQTVPHPICHYVWQLKENYKHVTGKELTLKQ